MVKFICNAAHKCNVEDCTHGVPHDGPCGMIITCSKKNFISYCVPIVNGKYIATERHWCTHCDSRGFTDVEEEYEV